MRGQEGSFPANVYISWCVTNWGNCSINIKKEKITSYLYNILIVYHLMAMTIATSHLLASEKCWKQLRIAWACPGLSMVYEPNQPHLLQYNSKLGKTLLTAATKTFLNVWKAKYYDHITNPPELTRDRSCSFSTRHSHWLVGNATGSTPAHAPDHWNHVRCQT